MLEMRDAPDRWSVGHAQVRAFAKYFRRGFGGEKKEVISPPRSKTIHIEKNHIAETEIL